MKVVLLLVAAALACCAADRVLVMAPLCAKSHKVVFMPIVEALAGRGHQVTVVTPYRPKAAVANVREIAIGDAMEKVGFDMLSSRKEGGLKQITALFGPFMTLINMSYTHLMNNDEFRQILAKPEFDVVIVNCLMNEFVLPLIDGWGVPRITFCPASGVTWLLEANGVSPEYASVPGGGVWFGRKMNLLQRAANVLMNKVVLLMRHFVFLPYMEQLAGQDVTLTRSISDMQQDDTLMLVAHHLSTAFQRSFPPNVIPLGGLQLRPARPLPQDLQAFADGAAHGLILFTLGSAVPTSSMPPEHRQIFLNVFSRIRQRVIWKWEKTGIDDVPDNVLLLDWLPQQDLLEHTNTKIFISHGGLGAVTESIYSAVPMLGLPIANDQNANVGKGVDEGWALALEWDDLSEERLQDSIDKLLNDPSYQRNADRLSTFIRDEMMPAREIGAYWVEHVVRMGGSGHLQLLSKDMPLYQQYLVDVWLLLAALAAAGLAVNYLMLRCLFRRIFRSKKQKTN